MGLNLGFTNYLPITPRKLHTLFAALILCIIKLIMLVSQGFYKPNSPNWQ